jgi:hypothetical protein
MPQVRASIAHFQMSKLGLTTEKGNFNLPKKIQPNHCKKIVV